MNLMTRLDWSFRAIGLNPTILSCTARSQSRSCARGVRIQEQLVKRIEKWLEARADEDNLRLFLEDERERALSRWQNPEVPETRFTILTIARSDIRRTVLQTADSRSMAIHGWANNLQDVEITPAGELYDELSTSGADLSQTIDFSRDLPERLQSDDDWALRQGIVEYVLAKSLEFQGVGDQFFRTDERIDPMMLMGQMLQNNNPLQQLGEELEMPEFRNSRDQRQETESGDWWREQAEIADKEGFRVFAITRLNHSLRDPVVKVQTLLVAKNSDGDWVVVHRANGEARPEDQSADALRELKRHPQVAGLVRNAGSLGMGSGIDTALRHGLATQQALVEAGAALYEFTSRYADELGGPPIIRDKVASGRLATKGQQIATLVDDGQDQAVVVLASDIRNFFAGEAPCHRLRLTTACRSKVREH